MIKCGLCVLVSFSSLIGFSQMQYPKTAKVSQTDEYHGVKIEDPYRWLEDDNSRETKEWVSEENKVTEDYLAKIPYRQDIRDRMSKMFNYTRFGIPFRNNEYFYYFKNNGLQNQSLYRTKGLKAKEELVIDPNTLSADGTTQLKDLEVSKNGKYAAWSISKGGSDWETTYVRDPENMRDLPDSLSWVKLSTPSWQGDGFYYSRYPAPKPGEELSNENANHQVWYHKAGTQQDQDALIYEDTLHTQRFNYAAVSEDERYLFLTIYDLGSGYIGNALWYCDSKSNNKQFVPVVAEVGQSLHLFLEEVKGKFLILTNDSAPNSKIVSFDPKKQEGKNWKTIVKESKYSLAAADVAGERIFLQYLKDAPPECSNIP